MDLLCELIEFRQNRHSIVLEDLGSVKKTGLGRMVNAFKQSYYFYNGTKDDFGPHTSDMGRTIHARTTGVGKNSDVVSIDESVTGWTFVKKMYRKTIREGRGIPVAVVFYIAGKAVALIITSEDSFSNSKHVVGLSWDFTGVGSDEEVADIVDGIELHDRTAHGVAQKNVDSRKSEQTHVMKKRRWDDEEKGPQTRHYQGVGVTIKDAAEFVEKMVKIFGSELKMRLILAEKSASKEPSTDLA